MASMPDTIRILVVDDSEDDRELCRRALERVKDARYNIDEADDGDKAISRVARSTPDCVLLDYSLPGRNGVEVLKLIRATHPFTPILMLTGQGSESIAVSAMQQGAQNYIAKSAIDADHIHHAIQVAIAHCEMQRRIHEQRLSREIFTRALAHDLKEPVRTIRSFITVIAETETLSVEGRTYFNFVETAADRMSALIEAVYDFTRLDASALPSSHEQIDVGEILSAAQADLTELITERGATVCLTAPMPVVDGDRGRLRQVLQNLISNAIHHGAAQPRVTISAEERSRHWLISVADNGPGVAEDQRLKIFEPFSRLSKHNGLGMGLAICKRIVEAHKGKIWCENNEGGGAAFRFALPKEKQSAQTGSNISAARRANANCMDTHDLATILVVDDNEAAIELARIMLVEQSKLRCRILSAKSGQEAIATIRDATGSASPVDLVLLDINMPVMDGFGVLIELGKTANLPHPPVIMCSTSSYDKDKERAKALGACGYLEKPPQLRHLQPILERIDSVRMESHPGGPALLRVA
jgi:signal transduction histidine kinase